MNRVDIAIPLGPESRSNNDELRLFLRSLEEHGSGWRRVLLMTDCAPEWLAEDDALRVYPAHDHHRHNKDANLFEKMELALAITDGTDMVFSADDCAIMEPVNFQFLPPIWNPRGPKHFERPADGKEWGKWKKRMWHTLGELGMEWGNWDTHTPQRWNVEAARKAIAATPYTRPEGRCIDTAVMGRMFGGKRPEDAVLQETVKETVESQEEAAKARLDKVFVVYNDDGFLAGLRERLFERFPAPSRWETER